MRLGGLKPGNYLFDGVKALELSNAFLGKSNEELAKNPSQCYRLVAWAYRCAQFRAQAVCDMPFVIRRLDSSEEPPDAEIPWKKKLKRNLWLVEASLCLFGRGYLFRQRNPVKTLALQFVLATTVREKYDAQNGIAGFTRTLGRGRMQNDDQQTGWFEEEGLRDKGVPAGATSGEQSLEPHELLYFHLPDPLVEVGPGRSPAAVALESAQLVRAAGVFATKFFERQAIPLTLLSVKGNPSDQDKRELESGWKRMLSGVKNAWKVMAISEDVKPIILGAPIRDLGMPGLEESARRKICVAFGVPVSMLEDSATYASAREGRKSFYSETIIPECSLIEEVLNDQFLNELGYEIEFQPNTLEVMQQDEVERAGALLALRNAGVDLLDAFDILGYDIPPDVLERIAAQERKHQAIIDQQTEQHLQQQFANLQQQQLAQQQASGVPPAGMPQVRTPEAEGTPPGVSGPAPGVDFGPPPQGPPQQGPPPGAPQGMTPRPPLLPRPGPRRRRLAMPHGGPQSVDEILNRINAPGAASAVVGNGRGRGWGA